MNKPKAPPKALDLEESVAGEEDPGAAIDETMTPGKASDAQPRSVVPRVKPKDDTPASDE